MLLASRALRPIASNGPPGINRISVNDTNTTIIKTGMLCKVRFSINFSIPDPPSRFAKPLTNWLINCMVRHLFYLLLGGWGQQTFQYIATRCVAGDRGVQRRVLSLGNEIDIARDICIFHLSPIRTW